MQVLWKNAAAQFHVCAFPVELLVELKQELVYFTRQVFCKSS